MARPPEPAWDRPAARPRGRVVVAVIAVLAAAGAGALAASDVAERDHGRLAVDDVGAAANDDRGGDGDRPPPLGRWSVDGAPGDVQRLPAPTWIDTGLVTLAEDRDGELTGWVLDADEGDWRSLGTAPVEGVRRTAARGRWWVIHGTDGLVAYDLRADRWHEPDPATRIDGMRLIGVAGDAAVALRRRGPEAETLVIDLVDGGVQASSSPFRDGEVAAVDVGDDALGVIGRLASPPARRAVAVFEPDDGWDAPEPPPAGVDDAWSWRGATTPDPAGGDLLVHLDGHRPVSWRWRRDGGWERVSLPALPPEAGDPGQSANWYVLERWLVRQPALGGLAQAVAVDLERRADGWRPLARLPSRLVSEVPSVVAGADRLAIVVRASSDTDGPQVLRLRFDAANPTARPTTARSHPERRRPALHPTRRRGYERVPPRARAAVAGTCPRRVG